MLLVQKMLLLFFAVVFFLLSFLLYGNFLKKRAVLSATKQEKCYGASWDPSQGTLLNTQKTTKAATEAAISQSFSFYCCLAERWTPVPFDTLPSYEFKMNAMFILYKLLLLLTNEEVFCDRSEDTCGTMVVVGIDRC